MNYKTSFLTFLGVIAMGLPLVSSAAALSGELEFGMSGPEVSTLQTFLAADPSIYPEGLVTGYFGSLTKAGVTRFQAKNGIATVGRVGPITLAALNAQMGGGNTIGSDREAPLIGLLNVTASSSSATFSWITGKKTSAIIYYDTVPLALTEAAPGKSVTVSGQSFLVHTDPRISHSATLTGLKANTAYYYVIYVRDISGNENTTRLSSFQTAN